MLILISIPPNTTIQQRLQLCFNKENTEYPPIYRYFHIGKTLYKWKLEFTIANLTKEAIQKQLHNKFKTTAGSTNSHYRLRAAFRLYDLFHTCENVLQNPIFQSLKIQYIGKLTELKFQQFSDQISSIILDYYLEMTNSTWILMELSLEEEGVEKKKAKNEKKLKEIKEALVHGTKLPETEEWTPDNAQEWKERLPSAYWFYKIGEQLDLKTLYEDLSQKTFNKEAIQQVEKFVGKNNLTLYYKAAYRLYAAFQHCPNILLNRSMKTITFKDLQKAIFKATIKHYMNEATITDTYGFTGAQF
ncbi:hypothetical protein G9A89_013235 [Geosiphon pyriformis]|nr:hypothetical protein G9A89_013235 [Geosiphon pyriformis]